MNLSRRELLKLGATAGITVWLQAWQGARAALLEDKHATPIAWNRANGSVQFRVDGTAKVAGEKVFAYDIRARDMPHWPQRQAYAFLLRAPFADRPWLGLDLSSLEPELQPDRLVTAKDLARDRIAFPAFYGDDMLLPVGRTPAYLGHAVALLIYHDFPRYHFAKEKLLANDAVLRQGPPTGPLERDPWAGFRYVRVGGRTAYDDDRYSSLKDAVLFPSFKKRQAIWPVAAAGRKLNEIGMAHAKALSEELDHPPADWLVLRREYFSQSIDTAAMEADNANGWYDPEGHAMHLVVPTQSPQEVASSAALMLSRSALPVKELILHPCYTVGYGSKDHYNHPFYGLMAALYGQGRPVRLANNRFEQFQSALKRHSIKMRHAMAVDRKTGLIQSFKGDFTLDGGGRMNFTPSVTLVAATSAQSIYYLPKNDFASVGVASRAIDAGSARGYGTLQAMTATELMVDELAGKLDIDPIEFRLRNVLRSGMKNSQGAVPAGAIRADEVLRKAREHPLWTRRHDRKKTYEAEHPGKRYGVGFACVQKDFGTGAESCFVRIEVSPKGRIAMRHSGAEIGTGMATSQAVVCARWLGRPADEVATSITDWPELPMEAPDDPYRMSQARQDKAELNSRWTPSYCSPSSASNSAYYFSHAAREAARVIFDHGLWPAALSLWRSGIGGGQAASLVVRQEDARWVDGHLAGNGLEPLPLEKITARAHELGLVTGATVHTFNRWQWAEADFQIRGKVQRRPLDGLAIRYGDAGGRRGQRGGAAPYHVIRRSNVAYPAVKRNNAGVTYYSAIGTLVELAVDLASGKVDLLSHHSVLECGNQIVPQLVAGQVQGGLAMGIGHALFEYLPLYEDGPGDGTWNFHRYRLPRASDVAVWKQTYEVLPPISDTDPPKGIGEVTMIAVVPAIVNAVAHATGHRFTELPVTAAKIKEALA